MEPNITITVRMDDQGEPRISVNGRQLYDHMQRDEPVEAGMSYDGPFGASLVADVQTTLQALIDSVREPVVRGARRAAIRSASAAENAQRDGDTLFFGFDTSAIPDTATISSSDASEE
jgi:hypothetical protein